MTTWPTVDDLRDAKNKLTPQSDGKLENALELAKTEIKGALAGRYDVSTWDASTPPALIPIAVELAYGHAGRATHVGDRGTPSDETAKAALEEARNMLKPYVTGSYLLVDASGAVIASRSVSGSQFNRVTEPVFGMRDPITWGISDAASPTRLGGVDGFGVP